MAKEGGWGELPWAVIHTPVSPQHHSWVLGYERQRLCPRLTARNLLLPHAGRAGLPPHMQGVLAAILGFGNQLTVGAEGEHTCVQ